jgi:hypothetical protein
LTTPFAFSLQGFVTTGPLTLYVSTSGDDANDGLAEDRPKRNIQAAVNTVPTRIQHPVQIRIAPGTYAERVRVFDRVGRDSRINLIGTGASRYDVRIDGSGLSADPGLYVRNSGVKITNLSLTNQAPSGVFVIDHADFAAEACSISGTMGLGVEFHSAVRLDDCVFPAPNPGNGLAIQVEDFSELLLSDTTTIRDWADGIRIRSCSATIGDPTFINVSLSTQFLTSSGGRHFSTE